MELEKLGINATLTVCGCTPPREFVHERMRVLPFLDKNDEKQRRQLDDLYLTSDFLFLPTRSEAFGMVSYIQYLLGETAVDPTTLGKGPDFGIADWGIYHPDYPTSNHICSVPSVTNQQILNWILADPGYLKTSGSLKWVDTEYAAWHPQLE